ncbi:MAG: glycosyltransferase family 2 protein [Planctomycetes bacterium]|nr:glycosyltransferase family 2 protein [Planctomycetota bacterium]
MTHAEPAISVVVPVFNEEASVEELHRLLRAALGEESEILFVDDGSRDSTREKLRDLAGSHPLTRSLGFRRNYGKSHALLAGFRRARGRAIATIDGDLQDDPLELPRLAAKLEEGYDLVGGRRVDRRDSRMRILASRCFNLLVSIVSGSRFRDINCGLKVFRREVIDEIPLASGYHRFLPLLAHWKGFRVCEMDVEHHARSHGASRYGKARVWHALTDLVVLLFLERFERRPGRYFAGLGGVSLITGFAIAAHLAYLRFSEGTIGSRYPRLAFALLLIVMGMELVSMGLLAELIAYLFRTRHPLEPLVLEEGAGGSGEPAAPADAPGPP